MPSRQRYMSYSSSALPTATATYGHTEQPRPHSQCISPLDFNRNAYYMDDCASVGSSLSDDMVDEEEIFVPLNPRALAAIPSRLQKIMREIQAERYETLKKEYPDLRVMTADYWIKPVEHVRKKPIRYDRAPTPLYFAVPPPTSRWATHSGVANYASHAQRPTTSHGCSLTRSAQMLNKRVAPARESRVLNGYHQPMPPNLAVNQKHRKHHNRRSSGLRSLSVKPVASNLRARLKRSLSRLNKWMKNEN
ncbi:hypothetical protein TSTA_031490 [Talaromyces stipitatus ATCC 10500]|uniref:Uncharacterized protein n=1 Tax=Talaromyces stipitatus (strain ATCC 10500 / CBS 375.48 / QM 6759 / NRRL 1006) TaxID=441959 RepID=B8M5J6_TALSN|nr:uncharacterized protein TSTA_031490 [Talaromyces stipitatus ATCC 10500]EED19890.1 hypothetical protein TSTA_031490 [Talaromyces stipitatus ATCC 10500]